MSSSQASYGTVTVTPRGICGTVSTVGTDKSMCMLAIASPARLARRHALEQAESATDSPPPGRLAPGITAPQEDASLRRLSEKRP